jgi:hypothetical protein
MLKIKKNTQKWEANYDSSFDAVLDVGDIPVRKEVVHRIKEILKNSHRIKKNNFGVCLHRSSRDYFNILLGAINRVKGTRTEARFYVSTDSQKIMDNFVEANSLDMTLWDLCCIIPNHTGDKFSPEEKAIIDFSCLKSMNQIFSEPFNSYAFKAASAGRGGVYIPHEEDVFVLPRGELVKI